MTKIIDSLNFHGVDYDFCGSSVAYDYSDANLNIGDEAGNVVCEFKDGHIKTKNFDSRINGGSSRWNGKKVGFLGDSITQGGQYVNAYVALTNCIALNYGVSGSSIAYESNGQSFISRYSSMADDLDLIIVFGGTNDQRSGKVLGSITDYNADGAHDSEFYGALHKLMRGLKDKYKTKPIVFMTPLHHHDVFPVSSYGDKGDYNNYEFSTNGILIENKFPLRDKIYVDDDVATGEVLTKYVQAIKEVGAFYSIPIIDTYAISGIQPILEWNKTMYTQDGIHPNNDGGKLIANAMYPFLEML